VKVGRRWYIYDALLLVRYSIRGNSQEDISRERWLLIQDLSSVTDSHTMMLQLAKGTTMQ